MPFQIKKDAQGQFIRWGNHGKPYHFDPTSNSSMQEAYQQAHRQQQAIEMAQARKQHGFQ